MTTAPTTTPWRETPPSSPTPPSACRRKKVSRDLAGGDGPAWGLDQQCPVHMVTLILPVPLLCPWEGSAAGRTFMPTTLPDRGE